MRQRAGRGSLQVRVFAGVDPSTCRDPTRPSIRTTEISCAHRRGLGAGRGRRLLTRAGPAHLRMAREL